jgi:DNA-binding GntR family transcriptional regulator
MKNLPEAPRFGLSRRILRDEVFDYIVDLLLGGWLEPDSSVNIDSLARHLDVSPTPVREALVQLEHTGLVRRVALKGYKVAPPLSGEQLQELFDAREVVEVAAVKRAAANLDELLPALADAHERHRQAAELFESIDAADRTAGYRKYFEADWNFHETILRNSGNRYLHQMAESASTHTHRMRQSVTEGSSDTALALAEHEAVLVAFQRGDIEGAAQAMGAHIANARARALHADLANNQL